MPTADPQERDPDVAAFIRTRGVTRCPTACAQPTQASVAAADRDALSEHATKRAMRRAQKIAAANRRRRTLGITVPAGG
jgi:hypothetical protein